VPTSADVPGQLSPRVSRRRAVLSGRADLEEVYEYGSSHRARCTRRRDVLRLPQRAQPEAARHRQQRLRSLPSAADVRHTAHHHHKQAPRRRGAPVAICERPPTWWWIPATTTASGCPGWTTPCVRHSQCLHDAMPRRQDVKWSNDAIVKWYARSGNAATNTSPPSTRPGAACRMPGRPSAPRS